MFYNGARKAALKRAQAVEEQYNSLAEQGNRLSLDLYSHRKLAVDAILRVEAYINALRNSPVEFRKEIAETIQSLQPFREAMRIEKEAETANLVAAGTAAGGAALGSTFPGRQPQTASRPSLPSMKPWATSSACATSLRPRISMPCWGT